MLPKAPHGKELGLGYFPLPRALSYVPAELILIPPAFCGVLVIQSPLSICLGTLTEWEQNILWDLGLPASLLSHPCLEAESR